MCVMLPRTLATSTLRSESEGGMIPVRDLFESHLIVVDLRRSMNFFPEVMGLKLAATFSERKVA